MEHTDIQKTAAFTGHRFIPLNERKRLKSSLRETILACYRSGIRYFISGMAVGFDLLSAETVLEMKDDCPDIQLIAVVPFRNQPDRFSQRDKTRYRMLLENADEVILLSETYFEGCFLRRNDYMLNHASRIITYFNGEPKGGTYYTYKRAVQKGMEINNLYNINK